MKIGPKEFPHIGSNNDIRDFRTRLVNFVLHCIDHFEKDFHQTWRPWAQGERSPVSSQAASYRGFGREVNGNKDIGSHARNGGGRNGVDQASIHKKSSLVQKR